MQPDEQQELLKQALDRFLAKRLPFDVRRTQRQAEHFQGFWREMDNELGVGAAGLPEAGGGFGGGAQAEMIVANALGQVLAVTPYVGCNVLSAHLLAQLGHVEKLEAIATGNSLVVTAVEEPQTRGDIDLVETQAVPDDGGWLLSGCKLSVEFAQSADQILVPARLPDGRLAVFALDSGQFAPAMRAFRLIDDIPAADLHLDRLPVSAEQRLGQGADVLSALHLAIDRAIAALCAEAHGVASVMVADTVAYAAERQQFGVPLASFQALQHRMVDMWIKLQEMEAASLLAALKPDDAAAVSAAKAVMAENIRSIGQEAVQLHGAMGLTEELRVGHYFKRATVLEYRLGSADFHLDRYRHLRAA